jgi:alpha-ribazole phosphatase
MSLSVWRHPKPRDVAGRCIGRTEVAVDRRKAKRLAHRVRQWARRHRAPRVVVTSPLLRAACVGRWLSRWGWQHLVDARLSELDFGAWDGLAWDAVGAAAVDAWCARFADHAPGGGEPVSQLLQRCRSFIADHDDPEGGKGTRACCVVGHAGWISAALWLGRHHGEPTAREWPASIGYAARIDARLAP